MSKKTVTVHKYKVGEIVYCQPNGYDHCVYKCEITEASGTIGGKYPYYSLKVISNYRKDNMLYVRYERELSKRPERLVKAAKESLLKEYKCYFDYYNTRISNLDDILNNI